MSGVLLALACVCVSACLCVCVCLRARAIGQRHSSDLGCRIRSVTQTYGGAGKAKEGGHSV